MSPMFRDLRPVSPLGISSDGWLSGICLWSSNSCRSNTDAATAAQWALSAKRISCEGRGESRQGRLTAYYFAPKGRQSFTACLSMQGFHWKASMHLFPGIVRSSELKVTCRRGSTSLVDWRRPRWIDWPGGWLLLSLSLLLLVIMSCLISLKKKKEEKNK